jgi:hypothetical protein
MLAASRRRRSSKPRPSRKSRARPLGRRLVILALPMRHHLLSVLTSRTTCPGEKEKFNASPRSRTRLVDRSRNRLNPQPGHHGLRRRRPWSNPEVANLAFRSLPLNQMPGHVGRRTPKITAELTWAAASDVRRAGPVALISPFHSRAPAESRVSSGDRTVTSSICRLISEVCKVRARRIAVSRPADASPAGRGL